MDAQTSNMPKLSNRASRALDVLMNGGRFNYALARNSYTGREQFQWTLRTATGFIVKGYGHSTYHELDAAGFMGYGKPSGFTGSSTNYYIKTGG